MNKLIKPIELTKANLENITFVGTKEVKSFCKSEDRCSLRDKVNPYNERYASSKVTNCLLISCRKCFYNSKNYLNVLKYRKKLLNE